LASLRLRLERPDLKESGWIKTREGKKILITKPGLVLQIVEEAFLSAGTLF
jgi:hypothetical protein